MKRSVAHSGLGALARSVSRLALLVLLAACADDEGGATYGVLHGTVRDAMNGRRLGGINVAFVSDTLERATDKTDGEGKFSLEVASSARNGRLTAEKSGYETRVVSVFLDDSDVTADIQLSRE